MKRAKSIVILTAMATLLSAAGAYANQTSGTMQTQNFLSRVQSVETNNGFANNLDSLVTAGTITQTQAEAIQAALEVAKPTGGSENGGKQQGDKGGFTSVLDNLVTAGTITQTEAEAIQTALKAANPSDFASALDDLVTAGTITQTQAEAIQAAFEAAKPTGGPGNGGEQHGDRGGFTSILDSLVTAGTITQAQEDEIQSLFTKEMKSPAVQ